MSLQYDCYCHAIFVYQFMYVLEVLILPQVYLQIMGIVIGYIILDGVKQN